MKEEVSSPKTEYEIQKLYSPFQAVSKDGKRISTVS